MQLPATDSRARLVKIDSYVDYEINIKTIQYSKTTFKKCVFTGEMTRNTAALSFLSLCAFKVVTVHTGDFKPRSDLNKASKANLNRFPAFCCGCNNNEVSMVNLSMRHSGRAEESMFKSWRGCVQKFDAP